MAAWLSRLHEQADIVVAAEGGGTVSAVAAVLIHRALLRHLVEGHGELFAKSWQIPPLLSAACEVIRQGQTRWVDVLTG